MSAIIEIKDLCFSYPKAPKKTLNNINLQIKAGQWVALIGHNGSGKSTLAKAIDGLLVPQSGQIFVDGQLLDAQSVWEIRKKIGMVFQNPDNQFVGADVEGDIAFGLENQGIERSEMVKRVNEALKAVDMQAFAKHEPVRLSGGQKQRVAIAGVLALQPKIVIFDESTSMLDPKGRHEIIDLIRKLNQEKGFTVISITHDIDEAALADRVIVLDDGVIVADDQPAKIFARGQELIELGLDVPYPEKLKQALKNNGVEVLEQYLDEERMVEWICQLVLKN